MANKISGRILRRNFALMFVLAMAGCAVEQGTLPRALYRTSESANSDAVAQNASTAKAPLSVSATPAPPAPKRLTTIAPSPKEAASKETADITLSFDQLPLPSFIQATFGTILKKNYSVDPAVAARTDLVTLRTGTKQTPSEVFATAQMLLKTYGIAVTELGGFYRIAPDTNQSAYEPEIRRGRAQPEVPLPLRPVFNLVELTSVKSGDVVNLLTAMFGQRVHTLEDKSRNAILISGQSPDVTAALEAIQVLDQPLMRGRHSRRMAPQNLNADELSKKLMEVLTAEGYSVSNTPGASTPIVLISVPTSNSLLAFATDNAVLDHVVAWAQNLDTSDNSDRRTGGYFTYAVKYTDAQELAVTMGDILSSTQSSTGAGNSATGAAGATGATGASNATTSHQSSKIVVNAETNTLIFVSSPEQYAQLLSILKELDQPSKSALIEVTVAEVDLTDTNSLGVQWALNGGIVSTSTSSSTGTATTPTTGVTSAGSSASLNSTGGLTVNYLSGTGKVAATISALSAITKVTVLSTPRVMVRNGQSASITVGDQVPIITSQLSNANTQVSGTTGGILQTIQYLPTGVILKVKPVIHSGNRVELDVSQEVSSAASTTTGVSTSPTISTRKVDTKLSIRDGATVLLGGLMSNTDTKGDSGIPFLKDIPGLGQLFRTNTDQSVKQELIVLITPYIIDDDLVAEQVTKTFRDQLGPWAQNQPGEPPKPKIVLPASAKQEQPVNGSAKDEAPPMPPAVEPEAAESDLAPTEAPIVNPAPPPVPTGKQVVDPKLLEELRKAAASQSGSTKNAPN